ncbi:c-type cytochrome [Falsiroseomonas sp.]|uniref:c-type cytochrome n=1 Tax=Falsiroseomonas sp. TaxID=2870721 RepID=UPI003569C2A7
MASLLPLALLGLLGCEEGAGSGLPVGGGIGDPARGRLALGQYGCIACHQVPGMTGPEAHVGPSLHDVARRRYVAGVLPNTPENMLSWILRPQEIAPRTAMPDMGVKEQHARDIVAYLYTRS